MNLTETLNDVVKAPLHWAFTRYYALRARLRSRSGVHLTPRDPLLIVSLTSYPKRFGALHLCLESLLSQSYQPDHLILWLGMGQAEQLPLAVTRLQAFGLEVRVDTDHGPFTKIVHTLRQFPDAIIVTADDDNIYPSWWLKALVDSYREFPHAIHCHRGHGMALTSDGRILPYEQWNYEAIGIGTEPTMRLMPTGVSGVLFPPHSLHGDVIDTDKNQTLSPTDDDVWLKTMSMLRDVPCRLVGGKSKRFYVIRETQKTALWRINEPGGRTQSQMETLLHHYGLQDYFVKVRRRDA